MRRCVHNSEFECFDCADARHHAAHPEFVEGCRECKYATIRLSPAVRSARNDAPSTAFAPKNSWEAGVAKDDRGVPLLDADLKPIPVKRYAEQRHKLEARRHELANHPDPFGAKKGA